MIDKPHNNWLFKYQQSDHIFQPQYHHSYCYYYIFQQSIPNRQHSRYYHLNHIQEMNTQQLFTLELTQDQLDYIQSSLPLTFSLVTVTTPIVQRSDFEENEITQKNIGKRERKCPKDPYYQTDFQFYKNKKSHNEPETNRSMFLSQKQINSCKTVLQNLRKRLSPEDIEVRIAIGCEMEHVLNKVKKSSYCSLNEFITQMKWLWKSILNSHKKEDPIYLICLKMEQYSKQLINSIIKKRFNKPIEKQKALQSKRLSPEDIYLNSAKNTKRKCPLNFINEQSIEPIKRNRKRKPILSTSKQTMQQQNQQLKLVPNCQIPSSMQSTITTQWAKDKEVILNSDKYDINS